MRYYLCYYFGGYLACRCVELNLDDLIAKIKAAFVFGEFSHPVFFSILEPVAEENLISALKELPHGYYLTSNLKVSTTYCRNETWTEFVIFASETPLAEEDLDIHTHLICGDIERVEDVHTIDDMNKITNVTIDIFDRWYYQKYLWMKSDFSVLPREIRRHIASYI